MVDPIPKLKDYIVAKYGPIEELKTNFSILDKNEGCYVVNIFFRRKGELYQRNVIVKADVETGEVKEFLECGISWSITGIPS